MTEEIIRSLKFNQNILENKIIPTPTKSKLKIIPFKRKKLEQQIPKSNENLPKDLEKFPYLKLNKSKNSENTKVINKVPSNRKIHKLNFSYDKINHDLKRNSIWNIDEYSLSFKEASIKNPYKQNQSNSEAPTYDVTINPSTKQSNKLNIDIQSLEELHFIYNNLYQQNKILAKKFDDDEKIENLY